MPRKMIHRATDKELLRNVKRRAPTPALVDDLLHVYHSAKRTMPTSSDFNVLSDDVSRNQIRVPCEGAAFLLTVQSWPYVTVGRADNSISDIQALGGDRPHFSAMKGASLPWDAQYWTRGSTGNITYCKAADSCGAIAVGPPKLQEEFAWRIRSMPVSPRTESRLDSAILTDAARILGAFESDGLPEASRRQLVLFAETLRFNDQQKAQLIQHLWKYVKERLASSDRNNLVALGSAIRKLISYWPQDRFDALSELLNYEQGAVVSEDVELDVLKGLVYRLSSKDNDTTRQPHLLCKAIDEVTAFHSNRRVVEGVKSSAIASNGLIASALLNDERVLHRATWLQTHSLPWFIRIAYTRARRLLARLKAADNRTAHTLGRLPQLVQELSAVGSK